MEMAVAIAIIMLLLGSILVPLQTQVESRKVDETQKMLDQARELLLGYASAYGYFPCPADAASNGQEATGTNHATGTCPASVTGTNVYAGFFPAAMLGFTPIDSQGYALDSWGLTQNRIRYAVANQVINSINQPFTVINGMRNAGMNNIVNATNMLYVCNSGTGVTATNCGTAGTLSSNAVVVIWSVGPNAPTGGTSTDEAQNPNLNVAGIGDRIFVSKVKSTVSGSEFDDLVTWIAPSMIFNRLIAAGQLP